jgi:hypothetical protein
MVVVRVQGGMAKIPMASDRRAGASAGPRDTGEDQFVIASERAVPPLIPTCNQLSHSAGGPRTIFNLMRLSHLRVGHARPGFGGRPRG